MEWRREVRDGFLIVAPMGSVDHQNADGFEAKLLGAVDEAVSVGQQVIVDLKEVGYMSSLGLRILVRANKAAKDAALPLAVANLGQMMQEIFKISRFDQIIEIHDTIETALEGQASG